MPRHDVRCEEHGVSEVFRRMDDPLVFACPTCGGPAEQVFSASALPGARIEDWNGVGAERRDATAGYNIGLPGKADERTGKYRPWHGSELSNRKARDIAAAGNCTPLDSGRYRSTPR